MTGVTLLKHFTKSIVTLQDKEMGVKELGDLPLSILVDGKVRNLEKLELRKYTFTIPDENEKLKPKNLYTLVCVPKIPDGEPFLKRDDDSDDESFSELDQGQVKLRGLNYEVVEEIFFTKEN